MRKKLQISLVFLLFVSFSFGQNKLWTKTSDENLVGLQKMERASHPSLYQLMNLNFEAFKQSLVGAPIDTDGVFSNVIVDFPNSNGELSKFRIYEAPVMEKGLADRYPDIKSYVAIGIDNPSVKLRFSVTLFGLHVMSLSGDEGTYYIDTYTKDLNSYIVYNRKNIQRVRSFACDFQDNHEEIAEQNRSTFDNQTLANDGIFRQYRLAMACTIEYAAFHVNAAGLNAGSLAQKKAAVLAAMNVTMTRVNGIYERDMSLRMNLVANNDLIIFITADNFSNDNANLLINESQNEITTAIGVNNFDIGHTVSTGGGGLAGLGVVCNSTNKARGITGSPSPVGDPFDIDYVAHEMGHQFGGPHTFSSNDDTAGNCKSGNVSTLNAVEPGSGSTIMAYAGICEENVQSNSDAYFHAVSIASMNAVMIGTGNCAPQTNNGNNVPVIAALTNRTIPRGTAFMLTGSATDVDASASLTYCWEQTNAAAGTNYPTTTQTTGPVYRSRVPSASPTRYFPQMSDILAGNLTPTWEVTPNVARTLNFALTVRDNQVPTGGQTARSNMSVTIDDTRGPLSVTSQNTDGIVWTPGSSQTVTWAVNNTNTSVGGANVDILYTTDNGVTWTTILANTLNDGSETITVPSVTAPNCRIMVKASGNIFFSVNTKNIAIGNYTYQPQNVCRDYPFNLNAAITQSTGGYPGYNLPITDSFTISAIKYKANITHPSIGQVNILLAQPWEDTSGGLITALWYNNTCTTANLDKWFYTTAPAVDCAQTTSGPDFRTYSIANINAAVGQNSAGNWGVYFKDGVVDGSSGTFNTFTIQLCYSELVPVLSNDDFSGIDFMIYPNPNNGNFNIQFTSNTGNEIKVNVHDIRGREIFTKSYNNNGLFNETLQLNGVQSGVYLVTVQDGARKEVKKIVVQ
ncbi:M12 family metallo-peptidase [Flavobacterium sp. HXWNR69]|uniref:M12 family metallo-peptidase n=1 Tax=Flavobacterium fragile TaxID=2949085 RepID=A0ABT0TEA8_9FLAO|nr:zinc-dependent metalloprotease family protein [Flavobacterium sp. HXWNR69]MCL9769310.1 M12 family metallo-peptidase [Flavobacterium sp. HXWNR69]